MECGGCTACCMVCEVKAVNSPRNELCQYADNGCTIYESRPSECEGFDCFYSGQPDLPEFLRPDNLGVMLEMPHGYDGTYIAHKVKDKINVAHFITLKDKLKELGIKIRLNNRDGSTKLYE